jgi:3-deoxy-D-manno-octulosonic-acid transferase
LNRFWNKLYNAGIKNYETSIGIAALFHPKARMWVDGRRNWQEKLEKWRRQNAGRLIWMHCASLGEFEQGRPLLEQIAKTDPHAVLLLTFFSPSGFEVRQHYQGVDGVFYLPSDTPSNATKFLDIVKPDLMLLVKYEYWPNFILEAKKREIRICVVSGIFRDGQRFFGKMKNFWKPVLDAISHYYLQNENSGKLLSDLGYKNFTHCGDTRYDRVLAISKSMEVHPFIQQFAQGATCIVAGSTWPKEEEFIAQYISKGHHPELKFIIVPHEINYKHIDDLKELFPHAALWSTTDINAPTDQLPSVLIIDRIGLLSGIYSVSEICIVGGGFGRGIHNILEAGVWSKAVLFGPHHHKFDEARGMIATGGAMTFDDYASFEALVDGLVVDEEARRHHGELAGAFVRSGAGATQRIIESMLEKQLIQNNKEVIEQ